VGELHGVEAQVLGHPLQQGNGAPTLTQRLVHGVQEAVAGGPAVQLETQTPAPQIHRRKADGTCDAYCFFCDL